MKTNNSTVIATPARLLTSHEAKLRADSLVCFEFVGLVGGRVIFFATSRDFNEVALPPDCVPTTYTLPFPKRINGETVHLEADEVVEMIVEGKSDGDVIVLETLEELQGYIGNGTVPEPTAVPDKVAAVNPSPAPTPTSLEKRTLLSLMDSCGLSESVVRRWKLTFDANRADCTVRMAQRAVLLEEIRQDPSVSDQTKGEIFTAMEKIVSTRRLWEINRCQCSHCGINIERRTPTTAIDQQSDLIFFCTPKCARQNRMAGFNKLTLDIVAQVLSDRRSGKKAKEIADDLNLSPLAVESLMGIRYASEYAEVRERLGPRGPSAYKA